MDSRVSHCGGGGTGTIFSLFFVVCLCEREIDDDGIGTVLCSS